MAVSILRSRYVGTIFAIIVCAGLLWPGDSSRQVNVIIRIIPAPRIPDFSGDDFFRPNFGWILSLTSDSLFLGEATLVISDGVDPDVTLTLGSDYDLYLDFPQTLRSVGIRANNVTSEQAVLLRWETLQGSGNGRIAGIDEIEIPLRPSLTVIPRK